jgi:glycyl-radical enzyme activating protein
MEQTVSEERGLVFDIQRGSTRDESYQRLNVYLKGCPMQCIWCRNPQSGSSRPEINFRAERCTGCHSCAEICPEHAHHFDQPHVHSIDRDFCQACAQCVSKCPSEALRRVGEWMLVSQVLPDNEPLPARLKLSGGEPMLQFPFARALLAAAKQHGMHTCLETCGYVARARYEQILPLVDLFLYDYKATNPIDHAKLTGVSNRAILSNLDFLLINGAEVVLRCPLIPGINDTAEHLSGIAALSRRYPQLAGIEIIPYAHDGTEKTRNGGHYPLLKEVQPPSEEVIANWFETLRSQGCEKARL